MTDVHKKVEKRSFNGKSDPRSLGDRKMELILRPTSISVVLLDDMRVYLVRMIFSNGEGAQGKYAGRRTKPLPMGDSRYTLKGKKSVNNCKNNVEQPKNDSSLSLHPLQLGSLEAVINDTSRPLKFDAK